MTPRLLAAGLPLAEAALQGSGPLLEATLLRAGPSRNGTYYPQETLREAAPRFVGARCYCDHGRPPAEGAPQRSVADLAGRVEDAWFAEDAIRGRIRLSKTQGWLETLLQEGLAGDLSIAATGQTRLTRQGERWYRLVEAIHEVHSVDFVTEAAAGGRIERLLQESRDWENALALLGPELAPAPEGAARASTLHFLLRSLPR